MERNYSMAITTCFSRNSNYEYNPNEDVFVGNHKLIIIYISSRNFNFPYTYVYVHTSDKHEMVNTHCMHVYIYIYPILAKSRKVYRETNDFLCFIDGCEIPIKVDWNTLSFSSGSKKIILSTIINNNSDCYVYMHTRRHKHNSDATTFNPALANGNVNRIKNVPAEICSITSRVYSDLKIPHKSFKKNKSTKLSWLGIIAL